MVFESLVDPIFRPLLNLPIFWSIVLVSLGVSLLITFVYKWMTDQNMMKSLKEEMKNFKEEMKAFKDDPAKVMAIQKRAMETNMKYMMHSMKPTLVTFLPIIIIFGWLNANLAFEPIMPGQEFTTTVTFDKGITGNIVLDAPDKIELISEAEQKIVNQQAEWKLKGETGEYLLGYEYEGNTYSKDLLITSEKGYKKPIKKIKEDGVKTITINHDKVKPLNLFGWKIGWLGTYIIFSIAFSMTIRKLLKIH